MNTKTLLIPVAVAALGTIFASNRSHGALTVSNGDFSNLTGLTNTGGGWYGGVPAGWSTQVVAVGGFTVLNGVANLQTLGPASGFHPLYQDLGTTDSLSTITLSFTLSALNLNPLDVGVGIYNTNGASPVWNQSIINAAYTTTGSYTLVASNVPANTPITVAFWNSGTGAGGLDNVSVIPEPRAALLGGIGLLVLLMRRRGIR